ncbi:MAG: branched-chain amino acid ABC transporter permease [Acidimicrobiia bacterium]|nr:branched-chain amino acid ABC transporter permease [Acidimicrobiia bacterium]
MDWSGIFRNAMTAAFNEGAVAYALAALGLNIHFGFTGLLNFGQVGFMAVGAYGVAISSSYYGWHPVVALAVGIGACVVLALLLGLPALRLRADYLAISTIAASEMIRLTARAAALRNFSGGSQGINGWAGRFYSWSPFDQKTRYGIGPVKYLGNTFWVIVIGWLVVMACTVGIYLLMRSPWGRVLKSVREDEDAARALGKNAYWFKVQSLVLGGVLGGLAGMVLAIAQQTAQPDVYQPQVTFFVWTALILGGVGRVWSPIVGAILFNLLFALSDGIVRGLAATEALPVGILDGVKASQVVFMLIGAGLALLIVFRPQGIFGNRNEMRLEAN